MQIVYIYKKILTKKILTEFKISIKYPIDIKNPSNTLIESKRQTKEFKIPIK